ncbi:hypothetical protein BVY03_04175 [bacterium K02(2017)]|nr:hypothetical protein BVY03_04175 [bacterium K02(2017)]
MSIIFILLLLLALSIFVIGVYNNLIRTRNEVKNAWSQIDVQLKRRHDLIPNLVETVKGYMEHERETLEAVIKARQQAVNISGDAASQGQLEGMLSQTLKSLFAVSENYPELKANQSFLKLQEEITTTENKIGFSRQFYNDSVMGYNNKIQVFPNNLLAGLFNFNIESFFEIEVPAEKNAPQVKFS